MKTVSTNRNNGNRPYQIRVIASERVQITHLTKRQFGQGLPYMHRTAAMMPERVVISPRSVTLDIR